MQTNKKTKKNSTKDDDDDGENTNLKYLFAILWVSWLSVELVLSLDTLVCRSGRAVYLVQVILKKFKNNLIYKISFTEKVLYFLHSHYLCIFNFNTKFLAFIYRIVL